eukprot:2854591-Prymnesium_polylepis.1
MARAEGSAFTGENMVCVLTGYEATRRTNMAHACGTRERRERGEYKHTEPVPWCVFATRQHEGPSKHVTAD